MPRLCIVADTHRRHREITIPPCDVLIHCGDICSFRQDDAGTLADADAWLAKAPAGRTVVIGGNHDFALEAGKFQFEAADLVEDRLVEAAGLSIWGAPWCPELAGFAYYLDGPGLRERWRRIPTGIDVLVTHTPPQGILDLPTRRDAHLGCRFLAAELRRIRPRLHVFGHVHASHGQHADRNTRYVNAAIVGGPDLAVRHAPTLVDLPPARRGWWRRWFP